MIDCRCPQCSRLFEVISSADFGAPFTCANCGFQDALDIAHLAHFTLPQTVRLQLIGQSSQPLEIARVVVIVRYGFELPPLRTDEKGRVVISECMFQEAQDDEVSTGLMDHKEGDYTLNRYVEIIVPTSDELRNMGDRRHSSGWPILEFEEKLYKNIDALIDAYRDNDNSRIKPARAAIDLDKMTQIVDVSLKVQ